MSRSLRDLREGPTRREGQILPLHVFGRATPDRAGARPLSNVGSRDVTWVIDGLPELLQ